MFDSQQTLDSEQTVQPERKLRTGLNVSGTLEQQCPGYDLNFSGPEYKQMAHQIAQARQQVPEAKQKIVVSSASRAAVPRLIQVLRAW